MYVSVPFLTSFKFGKQAMLFQSYEVEDEMFASSN